MAEIRNMDMSRNEILINLRTSRQEYDLLNQSTTDLLLLPSGSGALKHVLTTGKLGNSNRIMLPKKLLESVGMSMPQKKAPASIFRSNGDVFLLVKLDESRPGIPVFKEESE